MTQTIISIFETLSPFYYVTIPVALLLAFWTIKRIRSGKNGSKNNIIHIISFSLALTLLTTGSHLLLTEVFFEPEIIGESYTGPREGEKRNIEITHHINDDVLAYKHWTGTYVPTSFVMHANGVHLEKENEPAEVTLVDNILEIRFDYSFLNGRRKGAKILTFEVDPEKEKLDINFDWKTKWQVLIDGAEPIDRIEKKFNENLDVELKQ